MMNSLNANSTQADAITNQQAKVTRSAAAVQKAGAAPAPTQPAGQPTIGPATDMPFDLSSYDTLQTQALQLAASAGLAPFEAVPAVPANAGVQPAKPQQQSQEQQPQQQQMQYFFAPQQPHQQQNQVVAPAFSPQPATAALQAAQTSGSIDTAATATQPQQFGNAPVPTPVTSSSSFAAPPPAQPTASFAPFHPAQVATPFAPAAANTTNPAFFPSLSSVVSSSTVASSSNALDTMSTTTTDDTTTLERRYPPNWHHMTPEEKRRWERNVREQQRSHKISQQIKELRSVLTESNVPFKPNKYSILLSVAEYIKQLQSRAIMLDAEHRKLIDTIRQTSEMVNSGQTIPEEPVGSNLETETDMLFVQGLEYKSVFDDCSTAALGVAALDGRILACNQEFEAVLGYPREELLKQSLFNVMQNHEEVFRAMGEMLKADDEDESIGDDGLGGAPAPPKREKPPLFWSGLVSERDQTRLYMNITLTRSADGLPKFFNCSLMMT